MRKVREARRLVSAVGWMSVGFGLFDVAMADRLAAKVGMKSGRVFRAAGAREIATGLAVVAFPDHPLPLAGRLAGDAGDLAILGRLGARRSNPRRIAALIGVGIVLAVTAIDLAAIGRQRAAAG